jgi:hypothetical protein
MSDDRTPLFERLNDHMLRRAAETARARLREVAGSPAVRHHPLTECLDTDAQAMSLDQLLHHERRTEIRIVFADQGQHRVAKGLATLAIARTTALPGNQSRCATGLKGSTKPENRATANTHQRASRFQREPTISKSIITRSRLSSRSLIWIVIVGHPERRDHRLPQ